MSSATICVRRSMDRRGARCVPMERRVESQEPKLQCSDSRLFARLPLHPCRAAFRKSLDLFLAGHGDITGVGGEEGAVGPAEAERFLRRAAVEQAVDKARGEAVA